jgi:hypothetical protein
VANVIDSLGAPWSSLITALLLALLARACFVVTQHAADKRFGWLLSASVATGLAIADFHNVISALPKNWAAGLGIVIATLFALRCLTRQHLRSCARPTDRGASGATHGLLKKQTAQHLRDADKLDKADSDDGRSNPWPTDAR